MSIVYLNLDEVIRIIRESDDPKAEMVARWDLTEVQVEAILNMRLRALRRLEEIAIKKELNQLAAESAKLEALLASDKRQWRALAKEVAGTQAEFGGDTPLGRRRTLIGAAPEPVAIPAAALVEREPITVLLSQKGWIRAVQRTRRSTPPSRNTRKATGRVLRCRPKRSTGCSFSAATAGSIRSQPTVCRAAAARASRCG